MRISENSDGVEANAQSYGSVFSADGTKVLFHSWASNLVTEDNNDVADVFIKDLATGEVTRVSTNQSGEEGNSDSTAVAFPADGTKILFTSRASNLVNNDLNGKQDVFIKDLKTGEVTLVSGESLEGFNGDSDAVAISADGTKILFNSSANNIVVDDTNNATDAFIKDLTTGKITRVTSNDNAEEAKLGGFAVGMSADGLTVLFSSSSTNLVANDTNGKIDVFVKDMSTGKVIRANVNQNNEQANQHAEAYEISADGTKVLFDSNADNLVQEDKNLTNDEKYLAATILNKVYDCMEHDSDLDASIDGGRFTMMLQSDDMIALRELIIKLEK